MIEKKSSLSSQDDTSDVVINNFNTYHVIDDIFREEIILSAMLRTFLLQGN